MTRGDALSDQSKDRRMRKLMGATGIATAFSAGTFLPGHGRAIAGQTRLEAVINDINNIRDVSFYFRQSPHTYGPYYDYAYRPGNIEYRGFLTAATVVADSFPEKSEEAPTTVTIGDDKIC
jgi:hypothetical protein